jgi:ketosteroid isomerase-like protein
MSDTKPRTLPEQGWAHKIGAVKMGPHGARGIADDLASKFEIHELFARWGIAYDEARLDVIESMFTEDAVFEVTQAGEKRSGRLESRAAMLETVRKALAFQADQRRHFMTNVVIERLTATEATALAYGMVTVAANGLSFGASVIYTADLRRERDGVWRFSSFYIGMDAYAGPPPPVTR